MEGENENELGKLLRDYVGKLLEEYGQRREFIDRESGAAIMQAAIERQRQESSRSLLGLAAVGVAAGILAAAGGFVAAVAVEKDIGIRGSAEAAGIMIREDWPQLSALLKLNPSLGSALGRCEAAAEKAPGGKTCSLPVWIERSDAAVMPAGAEPAGQDGPAWKMWLAGALAFFCFGAGFGLAKRRKAAAQSR